MHVIKDVLSFLVKTTEQLCFGCICLLRVTSVSPIYVYGLEVVNFL